MPGKGIQRAQGYAKINLIKYRILLLIEGMPIVESKDKNQIKKC